MKNKIRNEILVKLQKLDLTERQLQTQDLISQMLKLPEIIKAQTIGITISKFPEVDTHELINKFWNLKKKIYCPVVLSHRKMDLVEINAQTEFKKNDYGIVEPKWNHKLVNNQPDVLVVPGIGFSLKNNQRIGFGGGYYDRFLKLYRGYSIAMMLSVQDISDYFWKIEEEDMKVNKIIFF